MNNAVTRCWICGVLAKSGEHIPKSATLREVFGAVSQEKPLYYSNNKRHNLKLQSVNSKYVKFRVLCDECNTGRTQSYDLAWDQLWRYLSSNDSFLAIGSWIHRSRFFSSCSAARMVDLHLYVVKLIRCIASSKDLNIDMIGLADAVGRRKPYPWVFFGIGKRVWLTEKKLVVLSDPIVIKDEATGKCIFVEFFLVIDRWEFQFIYAAPGHLYDGMKNCWNPVSTRFTHKLKLKRF